ARLILTLGWATLIVCVALGSIANSPLHPSFRQRVSVLAIMPEGWAFFTRNPREAVTRVYKKAAGLNWLLISEPNFSKRHLYGFHCAGRLITNELGNLLSGLAPERWTECKGPVGECMDRRLLEPIVIHKQPRVLKELCGEIVVQVTEPLPWAWARRRTQEEMPSKWIKLDVNCMREIR